MSKWELKGDYFEACNCDVACPCVFLSPPNGDDCTVLLAYHIDKGKFEGTKLDGLNAALAIHSPGHMMKVKWEAALYLDSKADKDQTEALWQIFLGKAGGAPAGMAPLIGKYLGSKSLPMSYSIEGKNHRMKVSNVAEMEIEDIEGIGGHKVTIQDAPLANHLVTVAKSKRLNFVDHRMSWEISGKNGFHSPISWKGP